MWTPSVLVVAATPEQLSHAKTCLSSWDFVAVPIEGVAQIPETLKIPDLVFLQGQGKGTRVETAIRELQKSTSLKSVPLLLVIGRYELNLRNALAGVRNSSFILAPFTGNELQDKIDSLLEESD
jgi:DNA-binding response OmpR family regulator